MQTLDQELLQKLTKVGNTACISIYMPTHNVLPEKANYSLNFKNQLKKGLQYAKDKKLHKHENLLKKLQPLIDDNNFWERRHEGLAILVSAEETIMVSLPIKVEEQICLADSF